MTQHLYLIYIKYLSNAYNVVIGMAMPVALTLEGRLEKVVELFMKEGYATSKAEVVRMGLMKLEEGLHEREAERNGWKVISSKSLNKLWDNPKEDKVWSKY